LRGAIVNKSKRIKLALEIETGALISEKGTEKRTYIFTTIGADDRHRMDGKSSEEQKRAMMKQNKRELEKWYDWLTNETARTFTPN